MVIDSKKFEILVDIDNVENITEIKDGKLGFVYFVPEADGAMRRRMETYEFFETSEILKVFNIIKN
jgi:hypothetical protein